MPIDQLSSVPVLTGAVGLHAYGRKCARQTAPRVVASAASLIVGLSLAGCGGGGSGSTVGTGGGSSTNARVARMLYDFDNNGTPEGVRVATYDAAGRIVQETYTYTDDGTPDADFRTFCLVCIEGIDDTISGTVTYTYDAQGQLSTISSQPAGGTATVWSYTRGTDGRVLRVDFGAANLDLTYGGDRLTGVTLSSGGTLIQTYALTYDSTDRVNTDTIVRSGNPTPDVWQYSWNAQGFVSQIEATSGPTFHQRVTFTVDSAGQPVSRVQDDLTGTDDYTWNYFHGSNRRMEVDLGNNGSVDAVVHIESETGPCLPVIAWYPRAEPNFAQPGNGPFRPGTGYVKLPNCLV